MEVRVNITSGLDKRSVVEDKCSKQVERQTTQIGPGCAKTEKEISVDGKSGVEHYKLKEASGSHSSALTAKTLTLSRSFSQSLIPANDRSNLPIPYESTAFAEQCLGRLPWSTTECSTHSL